MAHSFTVSLYHCTFSTKGRRPLIVPELQERLWPFMFSTGMSQVERTAACIRAQAEHHRRTTFQEEFLAFLKKHGIEYDERYLWD